MTTLELLARMLYDWDHVVGTPFWREADESTTAHYLAHAESIIGFLDSRGWAQKAAHREA